MARKRKAASRKSRRHVKQWKAALEADLQALPGVWVEDKGLSLAVHYRQSANKAEARRRILAAARDLKQVRVFGGKQVVNIVMDDAPHKGDALAAERDRLGCNWVLYVGDDDNDEDAFALDGNVVPVRIGRKQRFPRPLLPANADGNRPAPGPVVLHAVENAGRRSITMEVKDRVLAPERSGRSAYKTCQILRHVR